MAATLTMNCQWVIAADSRSLPTLASLLPVTLIRWTPVSDASGGNWKAGTGTGTETETSLTPAPIGPMNFGGARV